MLLGEEILVVEVSVPRPILELELCLEVAPSPAGVAVVVLLEQ